jgi:oligopeptidase A|tara:strand:- start:56601 stop:58664 length:2064 start_codon:yes stop_codon:yes gene_type:complete
MSNPLLVPIDQLIDYERITPELIEPAIDELIAGARQCIETIADPATPAQWDTLIEPHEAYSAKLGRAWSVAGHLNAVVNTPALRDAYNRCLPKITEFSTWVGLHRGLYEQYQRLYKSPHYKTLPAVRQRIIELALRDFRLGGVQLEGSARERYAALSDEEARISQKFSENCLDAVDEWHTLVTDPDQLAGIPADVVSAAARLAKENEQSGWRFTLQMPCYLPVMQYAQDRALRETLYRGFGSLASEQGDTRFDNTQAIEQLLNLRAEEARLLGYPNYAQLSLETRMAESPAQVLSFLQDLAQRAKPYAQHDLAQLKAFAVEYDHMTALEPWDIPFLSERLRESRYDYSEEEARQYFPVQKVLAGFFEIVGQLFNVAFKPATLPLWHSDAQAYEVQLDGNRCGYLMLDLYARQGKQSGAWVDSERARQRDNDTLVAPVIYLTCNFPAPQDNQPSLLTHDDVITLFHESGHALHALLSRVDDPGASAFSNMEWDAIELPSQFMENFCWEWAAIQKLSGHIEDNTPLPHTLFNKMTAARNFQSGMQMVRQIEFSLFDMLIHNHDSGLNIEQVLDTLNQVRNEVAVLFPPAWHRFPHTFSHLFAGGYAAGYYSYKWAEVLSADVYAAFEEYAQSHGLADTLSADVGTRFVDEILSVGASRPAQETFRAFRERDPKIDALLRHNGMTDNAPS